jgi:hypothetical protein
MSVNLEKMEETCDSKKGTEKRRRLLKIKERQATLLLGLILIAFIASWLPFFVMYVLGAFGYEAPELVFKFFFWLGYCKFQKIVECKHENTFFRQLWHQPSHIHRLQPRIQTCITPPTAKASTLSICCP